MPSIEFHSAFGLSNSLIGILNRADAPATFVMLRGLKLGAGSAQVLQGTAHVRLIGAGRQVESGNCH